MANPKISTFPTDNEVTGEELLTGIDGGINKNISLNQIAAFVLSKILPAGGTEGQALVKASDEDYDLDWADVEAGAGGGGTPPDVAYWIAKDDPTPPTEAEFLAGNAFDITPGQTTLSVDLSSVTDDKYLFIAEPIAEPAKTYKYIHVGDQEILAPGNQFNTRQALTTLGYYASNFQTSVTQYPLQLKTTA